MKKEELKQLFGSLGLVERGELLEELLREQELSSQILKEAELEVKSKRQKKPCPYCLSTTVYRRGKQNGVQMYQCRKQGCLRWYSETTGKRYMELN